MPLTNGVCLVDCLSEIDDPRQPSNGTLHDFQEILVIAIAAMLSDCDTVEDIAWWARAKEAWLRRFLVLKNGIPSEDTFLRVFRVLDPKVFEMAFRRWVGGVVGALRGTIAVDGKTVRGSATAGESAIHMVSAFATELGVVLGQEKVAGKSNEITAIPELLEALYLKGFLVSIDAMGCQKRIAQQIITKGGDYLLMVKGNQPSLQKAIETSFISHQDAEGVDRQSHAEKSHGRIIGQVTSVLPAHGRVDLIDWPKCKTIGRIDSMRVIGGQESELEQRYYISSRDLSAAELATAVRAHWGIENRLHWVLDVSFGEDGKTLRKDNAPQNLSLLRKIVLNLIRLDTHGKTKASLRLRRKGAAWDDDLRMNMLGLTSL
jgi:predicted transposase YbfD/YdcC